MSPQKLAMSPNYRATVRGLRELHQLTKEGRLDSPEADAVRDATDGPWEALTDEEKKRLGRLSEDLYSITDPPRTVVEEFTPEASSRWVEFERARQSGEWDKAFELLRKLSPFLEPSLLSWLRGATWLEAGDPEPAAIFFGHASELQPDNGNFRFSYLKALNEVSPSEAQNHAEEILLNHEKYPPVVVVGALNILIGPAKELPEVKAVQSIRKLIPVLESTLVRIETRDEEGVDEATFSLACTLLGVYHEFLGEYQSALRYYSKGLTAAPTDDTLLVARGMLLYGESSLAIDDFKAAVQQRSPIIWPYFFLAHHYLVTRQFERCIHFCERGLEMEVTDSVKSELAEWLAISQAALGFPADIVRRSFEESIRLDPSNERARRNLAVFEAATRPLQSGRYETRSEAAVRASGLSERRLNPAA